MMAAALSQLAVHQMYDMGVDMQVWADIRCKP